MFKVWTEFVLGGKIGAAATSWQRKEMAGRNRINVTDGACLDLSEPPLHHPATEADYFSAADLQIGFDRLRRKIPKMKMAAGIARLDQVEDIRVHAPILGNAAVFMLDSQSLSMQSTYRSMWRNRTGGREYTTDEDSLTVVVFPLAFYAYAMRQRIIGALDQATDFRLILHYGEKPSDSVDLQKALNQMELKRTQLETKELSIDLKRSTVRKDFVVFESRILVHRDYCLGCKRQMDWAVGSCCFGLYNCLLGTDLEPRMVKAANPDYRAFFGETAFQPSNKCMSRDSFNPCAAGRLAVREGPESMGRNLGEEKQKAEKRGRDRRLTKSVCKLCVIGGRESRCWKHPGPYHCGGPFMKKDVTGLVENGKSDAWTAHTFLIAGTELTCAQLKDIFPDLARRKKVFKIVRPVTRVVLKVRAKKEFKKMVGSPGIRKDNRWVMLVTSKYPNERLYISYGEMCELLGSLEMVGYEDLVTFYPEVEKLQLRVWMAMLWERAYLPQCLTRDRLPVGYTIEENRFICHTRGSRRDYVWDLDGSAAYNWCNSHVQLSDARKQENIALCRAAEAKRSFGLVDAHRFIRDYRGQR